MRLLEARGSVAGSTMDSGQSVPGAPSESSVPPRLFIPIPFCSLPPADLPKAVLSLEPPWVNVLRGDTVTLNCQGAQGPGDRSTQWFFSGTAIPAQAQPSYSFQASSNDSGEYRCQTGQASLSDPVHLDVTSAWLLLQTPGLVFQEGDPIELRCHTWRNWSFYKITFYQDGKSKQFSHRNSSFSIPRANANHSGEYYCSAFVGQLLYTSQPVSITVQDRAGGRERKREREKHQCEGTLQVAATRTTQPRPGTNCNRGTCP
uniref:Fc of IgG receptor IIa n=1 Tax=Molossus molossus TaxID=27622 RepID=A0A7J8CQN9_MOLMO|nr:Fc fragment of IgG receptor IIa [Molossus molossus]